MLYFNNTLPYVCAYCSIAIAHSVLTREFGTAIYRRLFALVPVFLLPLVAVLSTSQGGGADEVPATGRTFVLHY